MRSLCVAAVAACLALAGCSNEPLDVAPQVDLARFQGQWFEIAKLPRITQATCAGTTAFYALREGGLDVTNQCRIGKLDGPLKSSIARVNPTGEGVASKLSIEVGGFSGDYWILEVGDQYEYAVIGVPSRDYLWILSRTPKLDQTKVDAIVQRMRLQKFDTAKLEYTPQPSSAATDGPVGGALTPVTYGCTWSNGRGDGVPSGAALAALVGLAVGLRYRRRVPLDPRRKSR
jgi:apolipoprotein D and lipocalin family protein